MAAMNNDGQASVEAAVSLFAVTTVTGVICIALYLIYASFWIDHILYEVLICHQETHKKYHCIKLANQQIQRTLFFKSAFDITLKSRGTVSKSTLKFSIHPPFVGRKQFAYSKELRI